MKEETKKYNDLNEAVENVAEILRGKLPMNTIANICIVFILLRRIDCMLKPYNAKVAATYKKLLGRTNEKGLDAELTKAAGGMAFYNKLGVDFGLLVSAENNFSKLFNEYLDNFSPLVKEIFEGLELNHMISKLNESILYQAIRLFYELDLNDDKVDGIALSDFVHNLANKVDTNGMILNDKKGVVDTLLAKLVLLGIRTDRPATSIYDPVCGSCHTLLIAKDSTEGKCEIYGQDINPFAIALARTMAVLRNDKNLIENIKLGNTLIHDEFAQASFDNIVANLPFGIDWKNINREMQVEAMRPNTRFFAGLPSLSDNQFLFIQHIISKMGKTGRACFITNKSPLFVGSPNSAENEVRKYLIENDFLDCLVLLHSPLSSTKIDIVVWVLDKDKPTNRKGKVQIINVNNDDITTIVNEYRHYEVDKYSQIISNNNIGEYEITLSCPEGRKICIPIPANNNIDDFLNQKIYPYVDSKYKVVANMMVRNYSLNINDSKGTDIRQPNIIGGDLRELQQKISSLEPLTSDSETAEYSENQQHNYKSAILGLLLEEQGKGMPHTGDILINTIGGDMKIVNDNDEMAEIPRKYIVARAKRFILPEYLILYSKTKRYMMDLSFNSSAVSNMKCITVSLLMRMHIPLPSIEEQKKIVERNCQLQNRINAIHHQLELLEEYQQSVLEKSLQD